MAGKSPIRSHTLCPVCGSPLYYVRTVFSFLTGRRKRVCLSQGCGYEDNRRFRITGRGHS